MQVNLRQNKLDNDPIKQFAAWLEQAQAADIPYPNGVSLATASANGEVSSRIVLLRYFDEKGFVFFSSLKTLTAVQIKQNPRVSLLAPWLSLDRQVKVQGTAVSIPTAESLKFFKSRHKNGQIGVWLSNAGGVVSSKSILKTKFAEIKRKFQDGQVPMPDSWGGYRIVPHTIEFWQGQPDGLHDRFVYTLTENNSWQIQRLMP